MSYHQSVPPTEDRISSLTDSILSHILCFLPTKLASTTTVLSKRWNSLWLSSLTLTLDTQSFKDFSAFRLFIDSLFMSRDSSLPIQSFHLTCHYTPDCDPHVLNRIVSAAVQRGGIQNISLCMERIHLATANKLLKLVPCIFSILSCNRTTLVVLKLKSLTIVDNIPPIVDLPLLKTLHLDGIWFAFDYMFHRLLFGCPNLEDLHLCNVVICKGSESEGKYKNVPKLVTANLSILSLAGSMCFPFDWVHNAKFLHVDLGRSYAYKSPTFHNNVIDMELIFDSEKWLAEGKWKRVIEVLKHCPKLQNLTINEKASRLNKVQEVTGDEDWMYPETVPECLLYQLKSCLLRNYKGLKGELQFAEYIMQNSKQLGTMTVKSSCAVDKNAKNQMLVKLSMCSKGSRTCKLLFD